MVIIENVPVGVCQKCGERHYPGKVLEQVEETAKREETPLRTISVPVKEYQEVSKLGKTVSS